MIGLKHGDLKMLAEKLEVHPVTVRMEASGKPQSKRIRKALLKLQKQRIEEWQKENEKAKP